ncbi:MAG: RDD family protein [Hyphomicrobiales bacterium]
MTLPLGSADSLRRSLHIAHPAQPAQYTYPRGVRTVPFAGLAEAVVSAFSDAFLYIAACPFVLGFAAILFRELWPIAAIAAGFAYLVAGWATGQSPGMRFAGVRLVVEKTGDVPGIGRAAFRAALLLPVAAAVFVLADASLPDPQARVSSEPVAVAAACVILAAGFVSHLWALFDPRRRALHDIACGLVLLASPEGSLQRRVHHRSWRANQ